MTLDVLIATKGDTLVMDLSLKKHMTDEDLEYQPYIWDLEPLDFWNWQTSEDEIKYITHEAKSQGFDVIRFGKMTLWESDKWLKIKESIHG